MKSCKTITGTVVIEIEKGMGLGEVHQVFVDEGVNLTFVIKSKQADQPFALLSSKNIQGIGDFAVMVENSSVFQNLDEADLQVLTDKQGSVFDEIVITIDGNKVGSVVDYHIDEKNEIGYLVVNPENAGEEIQIPKSRILMIGKEYIILNDEKASGLHLDAEAALNKFVAAEALQAAETAEKEAVVPAEDEADLAVAELEIPEVSIADAAKAGEFVEEQTRQVTETGGFFQELNEQMTEAMEEPSLDVSSLPNLDAALEEVLAAPAAEAPELTAALEVEATVGTAALVQEAAEPAEQAAVNDFVSQQKRLLVGKKLQKDLVNADGGVILFAGDTVTDDIIDFLRRIDRKFLIRLAECVV